MCERVGIKQLHVAWFERMQLLKGDIERTIGCLRGVPTERTKQIHNGLIGVLFVKPEVTYSGRYIVQDEMVEVAGEAYGVTHL